MVLWRASHQHRTSNGDARSRQCQFKKSSCNHLAVPSNHRLGRRSWRILWWYQEQSVAITARAKSDSTTVVGMNIFANIIGALLAVMCILSAIGDFTKNPRVIETTRRLGIPDNRVNILGGLKVAGGIGIIIGYRMQWLGILAGVCLVLYFVCAIASHSRVGDKIKELIPAAFLLMLATLYTLTTIAS